MIPKCNDPYTTNKWKPLQMSKQPDGHKHHHCNRILTYVFVLFFDLDVRSVIICIPWQDENQEVENRQSEVSEHDCVRNRNINLWLDKHYCCCSFSQRWFIQSFFEFNQKFIDASTYVASCVLLSWQIIRCAPFPWRAWFNLGWHTTFIQFVSDPFLG